MANIYNCGFNILKSVDINVFWNSQNAPDRTIFIKKIWGTSSQNLLSRANQHHYRATYAPGM